MSREERRQYQRMMKGADRAPQLPPAARVRAERMRARREATRASGELPGWTFRFWVRSIAIAAIAGLIGLSFGWPAMPEALYVGLAVAGVMLLLLVGFRVLQRRAARA
jgi:hypothetical protein